MCEAALLIRLLRHSQSEAERSPQDRAQVTMQLLASSQCSFHKGACLQRSRAQPARQAAAKQCIVAKASKASDFRRLTEDEIDEQVQAAKKSLLLDFRVPQVRAQVSTLQYLALSWQYRAFQHIRTVRVLAEKAQVPAEMGS